MARLDRAIHLQGHEIYRMRQFYVYILASGPRGTLYVGVTNDLVRRTHEHRQGAGPSFTARYAVHRLVWFEPTPNIEAAIRRETRIKKWPRRWKLDLVEASNPDWRDLYPDILGVSEAHQDGWPDEVGP
jgi:putative endonuclease